MRAVAGRGTGETAVSRNVPTEPSFDLKQDGCEALLVGDVSPGKEHAVEMKLDCAGRGLWFRCEGALLWDPYGSLVRSVLMAVHRWVSLQNIYVVAEENPPDSADSVTAGTHPVRMGEGISLDSLTTMNYLLHHVYGVDPEQWLGNRSDSKAAVSKAVLLLREHPLMPESVCVQGFLVGESGSRLLPVHG